MITPFYMVYFLQILQEIMSAYCQQAPFSYNKFLVTIEYGATSFSLPT